MYGTVVSVPTLLLTIAELGVGFSAVYFIARRQFPVRTIAGNNLLLGSFLGLGSLLICLSALGLVGSPFSGVPTEYLVIGLLALPPLLLASIETRVFLGLGDYARFGIANLLGPVSIMVAAAASILVFSAGPRGALIGYVVAIGLSCAVIIAWLRRRLGGSWQLRPNRAYLRSALTFGGLNQFGQVVAFLNTRLDVFLLAALVDVRAVGLYLAAVNISEPLWLGSRAAAPVAFRRAAGATHATQHAYTAAILTRLVLFVTAVLAAGLAILAAPLLSLLFSDEFAAAKTAVWALLPGVVALAASRVLATDLAGSGRPGLNASIGAVAVVLNVVLNILWIPQYGIEGAALASSVSYSLTLVVRVFIHNRLYNVRFRDVLLPRRSDAVILRDVAVRGRARLKRIGRTKMTQPTSDNEE